MPVEMKAAGTSDPHRLSYARRASKQIEDALENMIISASISDEYQVPQVDEDSEDPDTEGRAAAPPRMSMILQDVTQTRREHASDTNLKSLVVSGVSLILLFSVIPPSEWLAAKLGWDVNAVFAFVAMLCALATLRFLRRNDESYPTEFKLTFPASVVLSALILALAGGSTGLFTTLLVGLMVTLQNWFSIILKPRPRPNPLLFFITRIPIATVMTVLAFIPPYAVAIPGVLLSERPLVYSAWCGIGYPFLAFLLRKYVLAFFIGMAMDHVKEGRLLAAGAIPFIATVAFMIATSLMFGNVMLLCLSESIGFALLSSTASIFTETIGKIYTVMVITKQDKLTEKAKRKLRKAAYKVGVVGDSEADDEVADAEAEAAEETRRREKIEDTLTLCAVRWTNEIVAEKVCIIVCAFVTAFFTDSLHSGWTIVQFTLVFLATELFADALLVYVLVKYFDVPILRLPRDRFVLM